MIRFPAAVCLLSALLPGGARAAQEAPRPNIVLILADDLGFSDLGCYGGEIRTPNLDALAANGLRFARFYNSARCCPSRASLMTGLYPNQAGVGGMVSAKPGPARGYRGQLHRPECGTIAEVLRDAGYFTAISRASGTSDPSRPPRGASTRRTSSGACTTAHEGGISTPCIVHWPQGLERRGEWIREAGHIVDLLPTCLRPAAVAAAAHPRNRHVVAPARNVAGSPATGLSAVGAAPPSALLHPQ